MQLVIIFAVCLCGGCLNIQSTSTHVMIQVLAVLDLVDEVKEATYVENLFLMPVMRGLSISDTYTQTCSSQIQTNFRKRLVQQIVFGNMLSPITKASSQKLIEPYRILRIINTRASLGQYII